MNVKYTDVSTNASFGWPGNRIGQLASGGPSPSLAAFGARGALSTLAD